VIRLQQVIPAVLADIVRRAPLCPEKVAFAWHSAVGPLIARHTVVHLDEEGVLHVKASDARWAREVRRSSTLILSRLEPLLGAGTVTRVRVVSGEL
jgi:predicted nucleic acid-binding Zn ribbon protein